MRTLVDTMGDGRLKLSGGKIVRVENNDHRYDNRYQHHNDESFDDNQESRGEFVYQQSRDRRRGPNHRSGGFNGNRDGTRAASGRRDSRGNTRPY